MGHPVSDIPMLATCRICGAAAEDMLCAECERVARSDVLAACGVELDTSGYDTAVYEELARLEPTSFWFRGRSRILEWALTTYFSHAKSFLDVGCGTGFTLATISGAVDPRGLAGCDVHHEGLRIARQRLPAARLFRLDARNLPFRADFDVVGAFDVLEHVPDDRGAIAALAAAVRPGGGVLISVPQHAWLWSPADDAAHHVRRYERDDLLAKLGDAGLEPIRATSFVTFLLPAMVAARKRASASSEDFDFRTEIRIPRLVDLAFEACMRVELALIRRGASLPVGGSLLAVARRPR